MSKPIRRISVIYPGAMFSVRDVARGYHHALEQLGYEVKFVDMAKRLSFFSTAVDLLRDRLPETANDATVSLMASDMAVSEIIRQNADLVLIVSAHFLHIDTFTLLQRIHRSVALILTESPYQDHNQIHIAGMVDYVFVNDRNSEATMRAVNPNCWYLPAAYDPAIHQPILPHPDKHSDVFLVGTGFRERLELLEAVDWTGIDFKLRGLWPVAEDSPVRPYWQDELLPNEQVPAWYASTKIALNLHRTSRGFGFNEDGEIAAGEAYSLNPRVYELAACHTFQVCDDSRPELAELFGDSIPTFRDAAGLSKLLRYYLAHPEERLAKAGEAYCRVQGQTFIARTQQLLTCIASTGVPVLAA